MKIYVIFKKLPFKIFRNERVLGRITQNKAQNKQVLFDYISELILSKTFSLRNILKSNFLKIK
jgi:hypothetical protein